MFGHVWPEFPGWRQRHQASFDQLQTQHPVLNKIYILRYSEVSFFVLAYVCLCLCLQYRCYFHTYADIRLLVVWNLKIPPSFELQIHIILFQHGLTFLLIVSYGMLWFSNILQYWILYIENSIEDIATRLKTDTRSMFEKCVWFETQTMYLVFQGPCTEVEDVDPSPPTPERKSNLRRRRPKPLSLGS